jgi:hypothetical protein
LEAAVVFFSQVGEFALIVGRKVVKEPAWGSGAGSG